MCSSKCMRVYGGGGGGGEGGSGRVLDDLNKKQIDLTNVFSLGKQS